jgi:hypothetical protein
MTMGHGYTKHILEIIHKRFCTQNMGFRIGFLANSGAMPMRSLSGICARNGARMALHF